MLKWNLKTWMRKFCCSLTMGYLSKIKLAYYMIDRQTILVSIEQRLNISSKYVFVDFDISNNFKIEIEKDTFVINISNRIPMSKTGLFSVSCRQIDGMVSTKTVIYA